ncbi:DUF2407 ubiquitin-like domain-containing protein [Lentinula lateritia]|uniref:DUF2407 ubiquitin-like domain-containing protein n=1 Tax=Lentinula aff. lateritia TaxID=2804960 RepID=A0ACC1U8M5_9AGAR|nr:DUF2407 ubiquitin-like domain-containing protein [Lentinula aff. lateritia]KAJ3852653.1 DUF2407 ubiquitin-like domain-containing protein [Lentinula lateritia]
MLSEKAKGKQKASDPPTGGASTSSIATSPKDIRSFIVRFTEDAPDLELAVNEQDTIRDIKKYIRDQRPEFKDRRLRLIYSGRLLTDSTLVSSWLKPPEERQVGADSPHVAWLHCSVGQELEPNELENDESKEQISQIQPARGFDRLASLGFSEEDIAGIRRQFHSQSTSNFLDDRDFDLDEDYDEHARALEEQWIDNLDNNDVSLSNPSNSNSPAMIGIIIGFFFPFIPAFINGNKPTQPIFWEDGIEHRPAESVVFPRTIQFGLVAGFLANVLFGMWRFLLDTS